MLEKSPVNYDDEVDIFEVLVTLWAGKFVVLGSTLLPLLASFSLVHLSTPTFEVKATYSIQVAPIAAYDHKACRDEECKTNIVASRITSLSNGEWRSVDAGSALALITESPKALAEYQHELAELNQIFRANVLSEAETEADFIEREIDGELRKSEAAASSLFRAKRVMFLLEREGVPLAFESISISPVKSSPLFFILPAFLGALAGSTFVLTRKAFLDRKVRNGAEH